MPGPAADTYPRFGGDEFVIVAEGLSRDSEAVLLAERLIEAVGRELTPERLAAMEAAAADASEPLRLDEAVSPVGGRRFTRV